MKNSELFIHSLKVWFEGKNNSKFEIVKDFSLSIKKGQVVSLIGPNACGKTTIFKCICGCIDNDAKFESSRTNIDHQHTSFGYVSQNAQDSIFEWLTVLDNIALVHRLRKMDKAKARGLALSTINEIGIYDRGIRLNLGEMGGNLSGGEKFITALLREMNRNPELLLIDEGFSCVEFRNRLNLMKRLKELAITKKFALLCISHQLEDAVCISDKIAFLSKCPSCVTKTIAIEEIKEIKKLAESLHGCTSDFCDQFDLGTCN